MVSLAEAGSLLYEALTTLPEPAGPREARRPSWAPVAHGVALTLPPGPCNGPCDARRVQKRAKSSLRLSRRSTLVTGGGRPAWLGLGLGVRVGARGRVIARCEAWRARLRVKDGLAPPIPQEVGLREHVVVREAARRAGQRAAVGSGSGSGSCAGSRRNELHLNATKPNLPCSCSTSSARDRRSSRLLAFRLIKYGNLLNGHGEPLVFVRQKARRYASPKPLRARLVGSRTYSVRINVGPGIGLGLGRLRLG